jgi:two-component system sensor kinase FixL
MKIILAHLAPKPNDTRLLRGVKRWVLMRQDVLRYGMAPLAVAIAFVGRDGLNPIVQGDSPYLFFIPAVLVAAGLGGLGPGLLATGLSAVLGLFVITDFPNLTVPEVVNAVAFVLIGAGIGLGRRATATQSSAGGDQRERRSRTRAFSLINRSRNGQVTVDESLTRS